MRGTPPSVSSSAKSSMKRRVASSVDGSVVALASGSLLFGPL
jgi:hypothetical protein